MLKHKTGFIFKSYFNKKKLGAFLSHNLFRELIHQQCIQLTFSRIPFSYTNPDRPARHHAIIHHPKLEFQSVVHRSVSMTEQSSPLHAAAVRHRNRTQISTSLKFYDFPQYGWKSQLNCEWEILWNIVSHISNQQAGRHTVFPNLGGWPWSIHPLNNSQTDRHPVTGYDSISIYFKPCVTFDSFPVCRCKMNAIASYTFAHNRHRPPPEKSPSVDRCIVAYSTPAECKSAVLFVDLVDFSRCNGNEEINRFSMEFRNVENSNNSWINKGTGNRTQPRSIPRFNLLQFYARMHIAQSEKSRQ